MKFILKFDVLLHVDEETDDRYCNLMKRIFHIPYLLVGTLFLLIAACSGEDTGNPQLTVADSMIVNGKYKAADELLKAYHSKHPVPSTSESMYERLLHMKLFYVQDQLTNSNFPLLDSLVQYYDNKNNEKWAWAKLCIADLYRSNDKDSMALCTLSEIESRFSKDSKSIMKGLLYCVKGDIYFHLNMYEECLTPYRMFSNIATMQHDTLRMAYAARRMGTVYTIENKADSAVMSFQCAIALALSIPEADYHVAYDKYRLSDIYIQIGEYDKAQALMPHDSLNTMNWAFLHYEQQHVDSAIYYFEQLLRQTTLQGQAEALQYLTELERKRGNEHRALEYAIRLNDAKDSLKNFSQAERIRKAEAQAVIDSIRNEYKATLEKHRTSSSSLTVLLLALLLLVIITTYYWRKKVVQRKILALQVKTFKIDQLLRKEPDDEQAKKLEKLHSSPVYRRIRLHAGEPDYQPSRSDWQELAEAIDEAFDGFTNRLMAYSHLTELERQVCYLVKIDIPPTDAATLLCKSKTSISMIRQRLYKKITGQQGTSKDLDQLIKSL